VGWTGGRRADEIVEQDEIVGQPEHYPESKEETLERRHA